PKAGGDGKARPRTKRGLRRAGSEYPEYPAYSGPLCDAIGPLCDALGVVGPFFPDPIPVEDQPQRFQFV
ncbi:hypothetical protein, partial [Aeromonas caviae]|uniref:hypothetical protein n=1 Tax=Aeromonas caviae TaxID=648 RepID=UPI001CC5320A